MADIYDIKREELTDKDREEMWKFVRKWDKDHEKGKLRYVLMKVVLPYGLMYLFLFDIVIPFLWFGVDFMAYENYTYWFVFTIVTAYIALYLIGSRMFKDKEQKYKFANNILGRYESAWEGLTAETYVPYKKPTRGEKRKAREEEANKYKKKQQQ